MPGDRPIVGGAPSDATDVLALRIAAACGQPALFHCSAVRVSPRALITAAHCVSDTPPGLFEIVREPDALDPAAIPLRVASVRVAPGAVDLAVIATTTRMEAPYATLEALPDDPSGATVTIVGYGSDGTDVGGVRRTGTATIAGFDGASVTLAPGPAITCGGDSGGPVLLGGAVVAITSFGDPACAASTTAVRVDASRAFIDDAVVTAGLLPEDQPAAGEADCGEPDGCCAAASSPDWSFAMVLVGTTAVRWVKRLLVAVALVSAAACGAKSSSGPCGNGRQHGDPPPRGTVVWCADASGTKEGAYTEWWPSGQKKVAAAYRKGRQHGAFASWHENGKPNEEGTLTDGLRTGRWKEHYEDGKVKRESDYGSGGAEYRWTLYAEESGAKWIEGGFKGQREHGHFVEYYPDGKKLAEGDFADGTKAGTWTYWNPDGSPSATELGSFAAGAFGGSGAPEGDQ